MFFDFQSISEVSVFIEIIKDAIARKIETIEIEDELNNFTKYNIFYNPESLFSFKDLKSHICNEQYDSILTDSEETLVIAFDFGIKLLMDNKIIPDSTLSLSNIIFMSDFLFDFQSVISDGEYTITTPPISVLKVQECIFCMPVNLSFGWHIVELSHTAFLEQLSIFDLYDELKSNYCIFNVLFLENYSFNNLVIFNSNAHRVELHPDQNDLRMESINIRFSQINEIMLNSHEYYKRAHENYDIETRTLKISDSEIGTLCIADLQADEIIIKRSNIISIIFDHVISNNNFIFKDLKSESHSFTQTFSNGREIQGINKLSEIDHNKFAKELELLRETNESAQSRGYAFEKYLRDLFEVYSLHPRGSFKIVGEQIDGSFELDNNIYLLEAKWISKPIDKSTLVIFNEKVRSKSGYTRGLFISNSEYTEEALRTFASSREIRIVLMTVDELSALISEKKSFIELIRAKVRALAEEGEFYKKMKL